MKKLLIYVLIGSLMVVSCKKNEKNAPVISNELIDFLFIGLENDISVVLPGTIPANLIVKASVGSITGDNGHYNFLVNEDELKNGSINTVDFKVYRKDNNGNEVNAGSKTYHLKALPDVRLIYAGKDGGQISIEDILKCDSVYYDVPGFYYHDTLFGPISGFTLTFHCKNSIKNKADTSVTKFVITGSKLSTPAAEKIIKLKTGDMIEFSDASVLFKNKPRTVKNKLILTFKGK